MQQTQKNFHSKMVSNHNNDIKKTSHSRKFAAATLVGLVSAAIVLVLISLGSTEATAIVQPSELQPTSGVSYNNLDNLINDFLDDAGNRLKKSKLNSMRQIKPTLRFGRRSDPLMAPTLADQLALMDGQDRYEMNQRRLLSAALAGGADSRR